MSQGINMPRTYMYGNLTNILHYTFKVTAAEADQTLVTTVNATVSLEITLAIIICFKR